MPLGAQLLIALFLVCAAWIVAHVALLVRVQFVMGITMTERWISLVPVATPYFAWKAGFHRHVVLWGCLIVLYAAVRAGLALR